MVRKSNLLVTLALASAILALAWPLRLFDSDERACKDSTSGIRIEACTRVINSTAWYFYKRSWAYSNRGDGYRNTGKTDLAIADYDKAIELEPNRSITYHNRGLAYQDKKDFDHAIADYSQAISRFHLRKPASKRDFLNQRAIAYKHRGDLALALADYNAAIRMVPHDTDMYYHRGLLFAAMNEPDRAIADYSHAIAGFDAAEYSLTHKRDYLTERSEAYRAKGYSQMAFADDDQIIAIDATLARKVKVRARVASISNR